MPHDDDARPLTAAERRVLDALDARLDHDRPPEPGTRRRTTTAMALSGTCVGVAALALLAGVLVAAATGAVVLLVLLSVLVVGARRDR